MIRSSICLILGQFISRSQIWVCLGLTHGSGRFIVLVIWILVLLVIHYLVLLCHYLGFFIFNFHFEFKYIISRHLFFFTLFQDLLLVHRSLHIPSTTPALAAIEKTAEYGTNTYSSKNSAKHNFELPIFWNKVLFKLIFPVRFHVFQFFFWLFESALLFLY